MSEVRKHRLRPSAAQREAERGWRGGGGGWRREEGRQEEVGKTKERGREEKKEVGDIDVKIKNNKF